MDRAQVSSQTFLRLIAAGILTFPLVSPAQTSRTPSVTALPAVVAGIPVNYDEDKVGNYTLPDALTLQNGKRVRDANTWWSQRWSEIMAMFQSQQFGRDPGKPTEEKFTVTDKGTPALNGKAVRKQVTITFSEDAAWSQLHLVIYLPSGTMKPVPLLLNISFTAASNTIDDPDLAPGEVWDPKTKMRIPAPKGRSFRRIDVHRLLEVGMGWRPSITATSTRTTPKASPMGSGLDM